MVRGIKRRSSSFNTGRKEDIYQYLHQEEHRFTLHYGDLADATKMICIVQEVDPNEIYDFAVLLRTHSSRMIIVKVHARR